MSGEKTTRYIISAASLLLMFVFLTLFVRMRTAVFLILGVIMLNIAFQFIARLIIGTICEGVFENGINSSSDFFRTSEFEEKLYNTFHIKKLKKQLPDSDRTHFSLQRHSIQDIVDTGCEIEAEHELCMVASVLGVFLAIPFGNVWLFAIVAVLAVLYDLTFVMIQRFNRPRLITVQLKRRARFFEKLEKHKEKSAAQTEKSVQAEGIAEQSDSTENTEIPDNNDIDDDSINDNNDDNQIEQPTEEDGCEEDKND